MSEEIKACAAQEAEEASLFTFIDNDTIKSEKIVAPRYSYWKSVFRVFFRKKINWVMIVLLAILLLAAFIGPVFMPYDPSENITRATTFNFSPSKAINFYGTKSLYINKGDLSKAKTALKGFQFQTAEDSRGKTRITFVEFQGCPEAQEILTAAGVAFTVAPDDSNSLLVAEADAEALNTALNSGNNSFDYVRRQENETTLRFQFTELKGRSEAVQALKKAGIKFTKGELDPYVLYKWCMGSGMQGNSIAFGILSSARTSLLLSIICGFINMVIGILVGAAWGYSKQLDAVLIVVYNVIANVPTILLLSVLVYIIGAGFWSFIFALTITGWLGIAYFFRTQVMIIRDREYSLASRCLGTPIPRVISKNILPFMTSVIVTLLATEIPSYISSEVFLSYIGIGLSASIPSLGRMISEAQSAFITYPWEFWPPVAIASALTIILYVLGQNLADASDPRTHM